MSDYDEFVKRMGSFDMELSLDDVGPKKDTLTHYGVLGMKWGVRRYQNKDGTLTPRGVRRYSRDVRENLAKKKDSRIDTSSPDPKRWAKEDTERKKRAVDASSKLVKELESFEKGTRKRMDLSNMSDKEMRDRINRELLETQYSNLFAEETKPAIIKGRQYVDTTLKVAGNTLAITSSALAVALAIKELKG